VRQKEGNDKAMSRLSRKIGEIEEALRKLRFLAQGGTRYSQAFYCEPLKAVLGDGIGPSDISDHLSALFYHALEGCPRLIVELGTRGGESTRILLAVAEIANARVLSVDINDCSGLKMPYPHRWHFVRQDDVAFGREGFVAWCQQRDIEARADVIFIDTSHRYEHTKDEITVWIDYLSSTGVMIFHDTNTGPGLYGRCDGSIDLGWDNQRGVIRAIEEYVSRRYEEKSFFVDAAKGFLVRHYPNSNGLTVLKRLPVV
jgi:predicted O-methyltransferase YrrM